MSIFPTSLDTFTDPTPSNSLSSPSHSQQHIDEHSSISALEAKVGVDGSAVTTSLDYKVAQRQIKLTPTAVKTANYTANPSELIPVDLSSGSFTIQLPTAPADGTVIEVQVVKPGTTGVVEMKTGGSDVFVRSGGPTSAYMGLNDEIAHLQYQTSAGIWFLTNTATVSNFAIGFPGVDAQTPITNANIAINASTRVLTITPPLGYFNVFLDGGGKIKKFRKTGTISFPAFTDTSGMWFFYFNNSGTAVTTQTHWSTTDFPNISSIYRIIWNKDLFSFTVTSATASSGDTYTNNGSTFTVKESISGGTTLICQRTAGTNNPTASGNLVRTAGAGTNPIVFSAFSESIKVQAQYIEYHENSISADDHQWFHLNGAIWMSGFTMANNALLSTAPNADGRNAVIALSTGTNIDDNLEYTITNDTSGNPLTQDLGNTTPASLNATNSALFKVYTQDAGGSVYFLPATRFPFAWDTATNRPQTISQTGVRTLVTDNRWYVYFIYGTQNPVTGEALKVVSATTEFTSLANAQAYNWVDIQNTYSILGNDGEIRPLYRVILYNDNTGGGAFPAGTKYSVIRETQDLRKSATTSTTAATGSLPASSVTVVQSGSLGTNAQSSLENLDSDKLPYLSSTLTGSQIMATDSSSNITSLAVATYPSLTEFSYVKGVTSAIQTQLNAKQATLTNPVTGTGNINEIAYWTSSSAIGTLAVATYPSLTELSYVKEVTSSIQTQLNGKQASGSYVTSGGALGTPSSGTLTSCTGLPIAGLVASTSTALGVGSIELGHATDTTISRVSAGVIAVEGVTVPTISSTSTLTAKRINPRLVTAASYTTDTGTSLDVSTCDQFEITAQAGALLFNAPSGTPLGGQRMIIRIKDNGTARALTYNAVFRAMGNALPTTTVLSKTLYLGFIYNATDTKWDLVAVAQEA